MSTIDMNAEYAGLIHHLFSGAITIIDYFHIIQLAGQKLVNERSCIIHFFKIGTPKFIAF